MAEMTRLLSRYALLVGILTILTAASANTSLAAGQRISDAGRRAISPEIAVGPDDAVNVIWLDKGLTADRPPPKPRKPGEHSHLSSTDLYFSRSEDGGKTWRSTDNGKSFSAPITINLPVTEDRSDVLGEGLAATNSFGTMGVAPDGTIITAWQNVMQMRDSSDGADGTVYVAWQQENEEVFVTTLPPAANMADN